MPVFLREYNWRQSRSAVHLSLPVRGARVTAANIFCTERYLKVGRPRPRWPAGPAAAPMRWARGLRPGAAVRAVQRRALSRPRGPWCAADTCPRGERGCMAAALLPGRGGQLPFLS